MNPYTAVDLPIKPRNESGWIFPVFIALVILLSIVWNG